MADREGRRGLAEIPVEEIIKEEIHMPVVEEDEPEQEF